MNIIIIGASSGIGRALAQDLTQRGHRVFGTSRKPDGATLGFDMLPLDVTSDASVAACAVTCIVAQARPALRHPVGTSRLQMGKALSPQGMWESAMRRQFLVKVQSEVN